MGISSVNRALVLFPEVVQLDSGFSLHQFYPGEIPVTPGVSLDLHQHEQEKELSPLGERLN